MRRIRIMGLCLVAVCAMGVTAVSSASAAPEYFTKGAVITKAIAEVNTSEEEPRLLGGLEITCTSDKGKAKIAPPNKTEKLKVEYKGCAGIVAGKSVVCQKTPTKPGIISTESLKGTLVESSEVKGGALTITNLLEPEKAGKPQAKFSCGTLKVEVHGNILARVFPTGVEAPTGHSANEIKATEPEAGCTTQRFLYINGTGPCEHLFTASGLSENKSLDLVKYTNASVEIHP